MIQHKNLFTTEHAEKPKLVQAVQTQIDEHNLKANNNNVR
jgi:hypothetical protein